MRTQLDSTAKYWLRVGDEDVYLNDLLGKKLSLRFTGEINCIHCGIKTNKSFGGGYCYKHFVSLAQCDMCIVKPELCHYHKGTCREPEWGESHCMQPHIIYLANSSGLKVGITRQEQVPTRWIDQGAVAAIPIFKVTKRLHSGLVEKLVGTAVADKTNWRKMLKNEVTDIDLTYERDRIFEEFGDAIDQLEDDIDGPIDFLEDSEVTKIEYPVLEYPTKVTSFNFDKNELVEGTLMGIKGQYLIFDSGVINIRKFAGYKVEVAF